MATVKLAARLKRVEAKQKLFVHGVFIAKARVCRSPQPSAFVRFSLLCLHGGESEGRSKMLCGSANIESVVRTHEAVH